MNDFSYITPTRYIFGRGDTVSLSVSDAGH